MDLDYDQDPGVCPLCDHAIEALQMSAWLRGHAELAGSRLEIVFRCPHRPCQRLFIAGYKRVILGGGRAPSVTGPFLLVDVGPLTITPPQLPTEVKKVSEGFVKIYTQAAAAEAYGLDQITGGGYRKALEFLIKDFCISQHPDAGETIKALPLAQCIENYVDEVRVKECAKRAAWLGNDETHYERLWEERDIRDLKILLELTIHWIRDVALTDQFRKEMPKPKRRGRQTKDGNR